MPAIESLQAAASAEWARFQAREGLQVRIGAATCGRAAGALGVEAAFHEALAEAGLSERVELRQVGCHGLCYAEPLVEIRGPRGNTVMYHSVAPRLAKELVGSHLQNGDVVAKHALAVLEGEADGIPAFGELPRMAHQVRIVLRNCGIIDPTDIRHYVARDGYVGLQRVLQMTPEAVVEEMKASGLRGRGGAGFPTGLKWSFALRAPGNEKYVICNADEGDPGAFMDRSVLEGDPHAVLEGLMIAGYAIGAGKGYVYCRAEYPLALERLRTALAQMREHGLLGADILGSGWSFDISIKMGAGAFVCGEETSLMASLEGRRGMPRPRPPFPANAGVFGKPTNINNVETLAAVSAIMARGAAWYAQYGNEKSRGTKTFALAGKIRQTGLIEVPMGIALRTIIEDIGGGVPDGQLKAVQTGGPSGGTIPASLLDIPVDYEHLAEVGSIMGSGGMIVLADDTCMVNVAKYFLQFTEGESCGKCVPCRMGTQHLLAILTRICEGHGKPGDLETLAKVADTMKCASLCALGQTAPNPVLTTIRYFQDEYRAHIEDGRCPAGGCRALITYGIDAAACTGCRACATACPVGAISGERRQPHTLDPSICVRCDACRQACRFDAVVVT